MPAFLSVLTRLFLGIPGALLWISGAVCSGWLGFNAFLKDRPPGVMELRALGLATAAACIGYLMVAADGIISRSARYRIAGDHLPELIGMEVGIQLSAILSLCASIGWVGRLGSANGTTASAFAIISILSILGMSCLYRRLGNSIERWEKEYEALQAVEHPAQK